MNLKDLSKEKKQYFVLGAIGVVTILAAAVFMIKFSLSSIGVARVELQDFTDKIERADRSLAKNKRAEEAFIESISTLKGYVENTPPDQNYYSWATEVIYGKARAARLEVHAIHETGRSKPNQGSKEKDAIVVESYSLRIIAHGGYGNVRQFLDELIQEHPLVRVTGLEISTGSEPEVHDVQLFVQWPFKLGHRIENWRDIPTRALAKKISHGTPEAPSPEPISNPPPPTPRVSPSPKGTEQSMGMTSEPDRPVLPVALETRPKSEITQVVLVTVSDSETAEQWVEKVPSQVDAKPQGEIQKEPVNPVEDPTKLASTVAGKMTLEALPAENPEETSKSASRLEALLRN